MIFKEKDALEGQFQKMELALAGPLLARQRQQLEKALAWQRAGQNGEKEAAYYIDFHLKQSRNWAVIHDLRLEWNGRVAQIDHLLIGRLMEIYVVETKNFRNKVRHASGGWEQLKFGHWEGIPCPIEQNERHIAVLRDIIRDQRLVPTRLGLSLQPAFFNIVLVPPSCSIVGTFPKDVRIYRMDQLVTKIRAESVSPATLLKLISEETLHNFTTELASNHRPAPKFKTPAKGLPSVAGPVAANGRPGEPCQNCGGSVSMAEVSYCRERSGRFGGMLLCRKCQNYVPK